MRFDVLDIEWDSGNKQKCQKHGVALRVVELLFRQKTVLVAPDIKHSQSEERFMAAGKVGNEPPIFVVFTLRKKNDCYMIRPISARYMHEKESKRYEEIANNEKRSSS